MDNAIQWLESLKPLITEYGLRLLGAILVLIIGLRIVKVLTNTFSKNLDKRDVSASLKPFLKSLFNTLLRLLVILSALGTLGVEMTSFAAIIAAAGLAVGLALSGTLQNFAGGVIILLLKPFKVGEVIDAQGFSGTVLEIQVFYTIIKTFDGQHVILPNGKLSNEAIKNYNREPIRRMVITAGIGYDDDIDLAKKILMEILTSDERVLKDPAPNVFVAELADSSVNLSVRGWATNEDFWGVYFEIFEKIKKQFDANKVSIPFPQRDVHMFKEN